MRAARPSMAIPSAKEFPPFRLDTVNECLWRHRATGSEERILLSPKAFAMLRYLVEHAGRLVTQDELLEVLWPDTFVQPEVLKSHVRDIRIVLGDDSKHPRFIETLPRRGYQFVAPLSDARTATEFAVELHSPKLVGRNTQLDVGFVAGVAGPFEFKTGCNLVSSVWEPRKESRGRLWQK
jgi:DNA-binding winged helix-turn-helix (wHTH) protein